MHRCRHQSHFAHPQSFENLRAGTDNPVVLHALGAGRAGNAGWLRKLNHFRQALLCARSLSNHNHRTGSFRSDVLHGAPVGPTRVSAFYAGTQYVAQCVYSLYPYQRILVFTYVAAGHGVMHRIVDEVQEGVQFEFAKFGKYGFRAAQFYGLLMQCAVLDQVGDCAHAQVMFNGKLFQLRATGHGTVFIHDFYDQRGGFKARHAGQVYAGFGVARTTQYTAGFCNQRENMPGLDNI